MIRPISVIVAAVLLLGPLITVELGLRALIDEGRLPEAPSSNDFADISLANLHRGGRPDVLIMGMSTMRSGIKPDTLERRIEADLGRPVRVQNVAQGGISLESQRVIVEQLAEEGLLPSVVITGVSPITLAAEHEGESEDWFRRSELGRLWAGCSEALVEPEALECWLTQASAVWRWRGHLDQLSAALTEGMPTTIRDGSRSLRPSGWVASRPASAEKLQQNLPRALARLDEEIHVGDELAAGWAAFVEALRSHGVEVVAVRMPYYRPLVDAALARNPDWAEQRDAGYERLEAAAGLPLIEVPDFSETAEPEWFRDPRHLSRLGAPAFTRQMWAEDAVSQPILEVLRSGD
ncbi:MAG: hypothetical protein AB1Z67_09460 [Candidatus Limnocylindrales bacterium]